MSRKIQFSFLIIFYMKIKLFNDFIQMTIKLEKKTIVQNIEFFLHFIKFNFFLIIFIKIFFLKNIIIFYII